MQTANQPGTRHFTAIGLMSGTSLDGIDVALIRSDGQRVTERGPGLFLPYPDSFRARLRAVLVRAVLGQQHRDPEIDSVERDVTDRHAEAVEALIAHGNIRRAEIDLLGFHGQTVHHAPKDGWTWQLGDGARLAARTGIRTVYDFRSADMDAGGEGAPLAPAYHRALAAKVSFPVAVLNLGGVGNVTVLGDRDSDPVAFDTGPANALIDDRIARSGRDVMDRNGAISAQGRVDPARLAQLMNHPYFAAPIPKSLDRDAFDPTPVMDLPLEDAIATLAAFTIESIHAAIGLCTTKPKRILVTGGGRHNPTLMHGLKRRLALPVEPVEAVGWDGDMMEAEAFAFLAIRSVQGLPLSFPTTTGIAAPATGGRIATPS